MSSYLGVDYSKFLNLPNLPDKIGPLKTSDFIGYTAVAVTGLLAFVIVKRLKRRSKRQRR